MEGLSNPPRELPAPKSSSPSSIAAAFVGALTGTVLEARRMGTALDPVQIDRAVRLVLLRGMEDRIALERVLSGFVAPGYHP